MHAEPKSNIKEIADSYSIQQIEDKLKRSKGLTTKIYFDTYDVIQMIQGIFAFNNYGRFDKTTFFYDKSVLVHALAYNNLFGEIHLLPPHQDELASQLLDKSNAKFPKHTSLGLEDLKTDFVRETGVDEVIDDLSMLLPGSMHRYIDKLKVNAENVFKAAYLLDELLWIKRVKKLRNSVLSLEPKEYPYGDLVSDKLFNKIKKTLDKTRPGRGYELSNFIDALALFYLQKELNEYKADNKVTLPVLYASSGGIQQAVSSLIKEDLFVYHHKNKKIPIVRDSIYFVMDLIFSLDDQEKKVGNIFDGLGSISALKREITDKYYSFKNNYESARILGRRFDRYQEDFEKSIWELIHVKFIKEIWLKKQGYEALKTTIDNYEKFSADVEKYVPEFIENEIKTVLRDLDFNSDRLRLFSDIYQSLKGIDEFIKMNYFPYHQIDVYRDYGLMRFSFDKLECPLIQGTIEELFNSVQKEDNEHGIYVSKVANYLVSGLYENNEQYLLTGLGVLWILKKYELIDKICTTVRDKQVKKKTIEKYPRYHYALLHAASLSLMGASKIRRIITILDCLKEKKKYTIWIGMAYVYFRVWERVNDNPRIPELSKSNPEKAIDNNYYEQAVGYIRKAIDYLGGIKSNDDQKKVIRHQKYLYSINNYIYYVTRGGSKTDFEKIQEWYDELYDFQNTDIYWQGRFYDTFGWYNFRKAMLEEDVDKKGRLFNRALEFNDMAFNATRTPRDTVTYRLLKTLIEDHGVLAT